MTSCGVQTLVIVLVVIVIVIVIVIVVVVVIVIVVIVIVVVVVVVTILPDGFVCVVFLQCILESTHVCFYCYNMKEN